MPTRPLRVRMGHPPRPFKTRHGRRLRVIEPQAFRRGLKLHFFRPDAAPARLKPRHIKNRTVPVGRDD